MRPFQSDAGGGLQVSVTDVALTYAACTFLGGALGAKESNHINRQCYGLISQYCQC